MSLCVFVCVLCSFLFLSIFGNAILAYNTLIISFSVAPHMIWFMLKVSFNFWYFLYENCFILWFCSIQMTIFTEICRGVLVKVAFISLFWRWLGGGGTVEGEGWVRSKYIYIGIFGYPRQQRFTFEFRFVSIFCFSHFPQK